MGKQGAIDFLAECTWAYVGCWLLAAPTAVNTFTNLTASAGLGSLPSFATHSLQPRERFCHLLTIFKRDLLFAIGPR